MSLINGLFGAAQGLADPASAGAALETALGTPLTPESVLAGGSSSSDDEYDDLINDRLAFAARDTHGAVPSLPSSVQSDIPTSADAKAAYGDNPHAAVLAAAEATLRSHESGGIANNQNRVTSAGGLFQFINSTWDDKMRQLGMPVFTNDVAARNAQKYDASLNTQAFRLINTEYAAALDKADLPVTVQTIEAMHRLGITGGLQAIHTAISDPTAPLVGNGLSPGAVHGNEDVARLTVGQFLTTPYGARGS